MEEKKSAKAEFLKKHRQVNFYEKKERFAAYLAELERIGVSRYSEDLLRYIDEVISGKGSASQRFFKERM